MHLMDAQVPAVVAVVVTTEPGPWFDETLSSLAAQDYSELSVLVLSTGEGPDPTERVAELLPDAFVRRLPGRPGYAAAANAALGMVEGAAFFLLCHDDVALYPDAVHNLVEESFRSNAGVVSPKFLNWDDPQVLLHVGMSCDKTGAVVDRIQDGEVDHGQHDAVRDVFVAPGGCILIRSDLLRTLGGFDEGIVAMGEDLDLSWRAQVAGSRVVVAPEARVRHREVVASGLEPLGVVVPAERHPVTMQSLQRRHELRCVLKCYGRFHLLRVLPQAVVLALGEVVIALAARDMSRARAVAGAWVWNARHLRELPALRAELQAHRLFPDAEVRRLQLRGSARLSRYVASVSHQGFAAASSVVVPAGARTREDRDEEPVLTGSVGLAFSEDSDFDELDDLGHRAGRDRFGRRVRKPFLSTGRQRAVAVVLAALVVLIGTRELIFGSLPIVGQLAPFPSWSTTWAHFFSGWQPAGVGTTAPATPAFGAVALVGTVLFGAVGAAQRVLLLGCLPLGAIGMSRLLRPLASPRARVVAVICYLGVPLPYGALGTGRWDGLVAYAAFPFIVGRLARVAKIAPFDLIESKGWRSTEQGQTVVLGAIVAVASSFAPAVLPMTIVVAIAIALGTVFTGAADRTLRVIVVSVRVAAVALVLCAPWVIGTLLAGRHAVDVFGLPVSAATTSTWGEVIRFAVGPAARSPLVWLLVAGAALPLLLGSSERLAWAARFWAIALGSWVLAIASTRGWTGSFTPSETVVLAPAAMAVAAGIALGVASFETDLAGRAFGWRQVSSVVAVFAVVIGLLPVLGAALGGRWGLPSSGIEQPLSFLNRTTSATAGSYRVLWLGDPRALPLGGWSIDPGLSYGLTDDGLPDASSEWVPAGPGPAQNVADAVHLAVSGGTVHLGRLLASEGVLYVVVVNGISPVEPSAPASVDAPPPPGIERAMLDQDDLQVVPGESGVEVYRNADALSVTAERSAPLARAAASAQWPGVGDLVGWAPALGPLDPGGPATGHVSAGTVYAGYAPAGSFTLTVDGHAVAQRRPAFRWAAEYVGVPAGRAALSYDGAPIVPLGVLLEVVAWVVVAAAMVGWKGWPLRRSRVVTGDEGP